MEQITFFLVISSSLADTFLPRMPIKDMHLSALVDNWTLSTGKLTVKLAQKRDHRVS